MLLLCAESFRRIDGELVRSRSIHTVVSSRYTGSVRGLIEEFVEVGTRRLVLAALKHKIAREFVEGCEQSRPPIGCFGDEHDRIAEALHK